jgi:hypothetical protein
MTNRMLLRLRCFYMGFGFGIMLIGTVCIWEKISVPFQVLLCIALFITLYFAAYFAFLSHKEME